MMYQMSQRSLFKFSQLPLLSLSVCALSLSVLSLSLSLFLSLSLLSLVSRSRSLSLSALSLSCSCSCSLFSAFSPMNHADFWVGCSCIKLSYERYGAGGCSLYSTFETSNFENGDCDAPLDDCDHMCHYTKDEAYQSFSDNLDRTGAAPTPAPTPAAAPTSAACAVVDRSACDSEDATTLGVSPACFAAGSQIADAYQNVVPVNHR